MRKGGQEAVYLWLLVWDTGDRGLMKERLSTTKLRLEASKNSKLYTAQNKIRTLIDFLRAEKRYVHVLLGKKITTFTVIAASVPSIRGAPAPGEWPDPPAPPFSVLGRSTGSPADISPVCVS